MIIFNFKVTVNILGLHGVAVCLKNNDLRELDWNVSGTDIFFLLSGIQMTQEYVKDAAA